ncbi:sugar nucleotide-binding protein [bacterium]|nr:sugar nucleotide-binding protein [bacterium]
MRPIVITGISGFIGGHVWAKVAKRPECIGVHGASGFVPLAMERQRQFDLTRKETVREFIQETEPSVILHLAGITSLRFCQKNSLAAWKVNHVATRHLAEEAAKIDCRFIYTSTDMVFDGVRGNYRETDAPNPLSVYGETKRAAERTVMATVDNYLLLRLNNCYGPPMFRGSSFSEWVLNKEEAGEPIPLFVNQIRSPIDVVTLSNILVEIIDNPITGILHLGGSHRVNRVTFGRMILKHKNRDVSTILETHSSKHDPEGIQPQDTSFDSTAARRILDTSIPGLEEGLRLSYGPGGPTALL